MKSYRPMLARDGDAPFSSPDWIFEVKWDGIRAIAYVGEDLSLRSRGGKELTRNFPELRELNALTSEAVLDGEIVVMREGRPDFQSAVSRNQASSQDDIERLAREQPATYVVFDILEKGGRTLTGLPLRERKRILEESLKEGRRVVKSDYVEGSGEAYYQAVIQKGLEGVMAKRVDSRYEEGRSGSWLKIKNVRSCDCVIFGYTRGEGAREPTFGALLLGLYRGSEPVYVGRVGTGFTDDRLRKLRELFKEYEVEHATLEGVNLPVRVTWLRPELACQVAYHSVTREGLLRMARFKGMREDRDPESCTLDQIIPEELGDYRSKRDFSSTPEPAGGELRTSGSGFVVQKHHARRLHWDLRLERDGVLKSWAVPKGPPEKPGERRLAVQTEDHPLEYAAFEGTIPRGQYGAGDVEIWDSGVYHALVWEEDKIELLARGERLSGRYVLVRLKKAGEKEWLLIKAGD